MMSGANIYCYSIDLTLGVNHSIIVFIFPSSIFSLIPPFDLWYLPFPVPDANRTYNMLRNFLRQLESTACEFIAILSYKILNGSTFFNVTQIAVNGVLLSSFGSFD